MDKRKVPVKTIPVSTRDPDYVEREINRIVISEAYNDAADYLRELIRKDFKERGIVLNLSCLRKAGKKRRRNN